VGESNAHVAPQDEYCVLDDDSLSVALGRVKTRLDSLLHCGLFRGMDRCGLSLIDVDASRSTPTSQGHRAMLPSKTAPSE
jgi:hypothetical protein